MCMITHEGRFISFSRQAAIPYRWWELDFWRMVIDEMRLGITVPFIKFHISTLRSHWYFDYYSVRAWWRLTLFGKYVIGYEHRDKYLPNCGGFIDRKLQAYRSKH